MASLSPEIASSLMVLAVGLTTVHAEPAKLNNWLLSAAAHSVCAASSLTQAPFKSLFGGMPVMTGASKSDLVGFHFRAVPVAPTVQTFIRSKPWTAASGVSTVCDAVV